MNHATLRRLTAGLFVALVLAAGTGVLAQIAFYQKIALGTTPCMLSTGTGTPEGAVTGSPCDFYLRTNGAAGTTLYVKETGSGTNTGWGAAATSATVVTTASGGTGLSSYTAGDLLYYTSGTALSKLAATDGRILTMIGTTPTWSRDTWSTMVRAAVCQGASTQAIFNLPNGATAATANCTTGTYQIRSYLEYTDASNHTAQTTFHLGDDYDSAGATNLDVYWSTSATTGNVIWSIQTACVGANENQDIAWNTAQTITSAASASSNYQVKGSLASLTMTGCAGDETLFMKIDRDGSVGGDTIAATANLIAVEIKWFRKWA